MKKLTKVVAVFAVMLTGTAVFAGPHGNRHHHHERDGLDLAAGIVNLVARVIAPAPVVAVPAQTVVTVPAQTVVTVPAQTVVYTAPAVVTPPPVVQYRPAPPRQHNHRPAPRPAPRPGHRR
ncbi:MAG: hypothetical protein J6S43_01605 [Lentisphaeria bacterium]|nr:hypothetical protein [Lentisphaeria bacterium]